jgi:hypothetical protein
LRIGGFTACSGRRVGPLLMMVEAARDFLRGLLPDGEFQT